MFNDPVSNSSTLRRWKVYLKWQGPPAQVEVVKGSIQLRSLEKRERSIIEDVQWKISKAIKIKNLREFCSLPILGEGDHHIPVLIVETVPIIADMIAKIPGVLSVELDKMQ